jgi:hypothetical protein
MRVVSPLGDFPFVFERVERRDGGVDVVGNLVGLESRLHLDEEDLRAAARLAVPPLLALAAAAALLGRLSARRR